MATRKIVRPSAVTFRDGFSPEVFDDLVIGWTGAWGVDPAFGVTDVVARVRAMEPPLCERVGGALWVLRIGATATQQVLALRSLEAAGVGAEPLLTLGLRDQRVTRQAAAFLVGARAEAAFPAFLSLLRVPDPEHVALHAESAVDLHRTPGALVLRLESEPPEVVANASGDEPRGPVLTALAELLRRGPAETRVALTRALLRCLPWREEPSREDLVALLLAGLHDPDVAPVLCENVSRFRSPQLPRALAAALGARPNDLNLLMATAATGKPAELLRAFDRLPVESQLRAVWALAQGAPGRRALLAYLGDARVNLAVRQDIVHTFLVMGERAAVEPFMALLNTAP